MKQFSIPSNGQNYFVIATGHNRATYLDKIQNEVSPPRTPMVLVGF